MEIERLLVASSDNVRREKVAYNQLLLTSLENIFLLTHKKQQSQNRLLLFVWLRANVKRISHISHTVNYKRGFRKCFE